MGRSPSYDENGLKKGSWTPQEDKKLVRYIQKHGHGSWKALPMLAGLKRCGKSCRLRWTNYLRPDIKRGKFSKEEEETILNLHSNIGNKWSIIASHLPGRTDNEIKNFWNTHLKKKLILMGFDPVTHLPRMNPFISSMPQLLAIDNMRDVMGHHPWKEQAIPLQEAVQLAKFQYMKCLLQAAMMNSRCNDLDDVDSVDAMNLLGATPSPKETMLSNSYQLENAGYSSLWFAPPQPLNEQIALNNQPDIQIPCDFQPPISNEINEELECGVFGQEEAKSTSPLPPFLPDTATENSISNEGGVVCSTSNCEGGASTSFWNEIFLEDPFLHEVVFSSK